MNKRMKYNNCPLAEVVYQINFPPILTIEANTPFEFQDSIRGNFSEYQEQIEQENQFIFNFPENQNWPILNQQQTRKLHNFTSDDGLWKLTLAKNMLSLSTVKYQYWEHMASKFVDPIKALMTIYKPLYYSRIALRYIDIFDRVKLHLEGVEWSDLLKPHICGCLSYSSDELIHVRASKVEAEMRLGDVFVKMFSGIGKVDHHDGQPSVEALILDCDYFITGKYSNEELTSMASLIHEKSHIFFNDAITEKLELAMEPTDLRI